MTTKGKTEKISPQMIARQCVAVRLRMLTRTVTRLYNKALRACGLTISQMNILVAVSCMREANQQDVCAALHLEKSTLSRDVEGMQARRWLSSVAGTDRRNTLLRITPTGQRLLDKAIPAWNAAQEQAKALLGEKTIASLDQAIAALRSTQPIKP